MSSCFTKAYASFVPVDSSLTLEQFKKYLLQVIDSEVLNDGFDPVGAYGHFADAFDCDDAFDPILQDDFQLSEHCKLTLESGSLFLEGVWVENVDDHLTRWAAWVLFREFGVGDVLSLSNETAWADGSTSGCCYEVHRDGTVRTKVFHSELEEVC
jgi:hypothetical protein